MSLFFNPSPKTTPKIKKNAKIFIFLHKMLWGTYCAYFSTLLQKLPPATPKIKKMQKSLFFA
jgi:hypothetical protein